MLCERCKKREANIIFTEVINGVKKEHNYCSQCASKTEIGQLIENEFPLSKLLSEILGVQPETENKLEKRDKLSQIVCPTCKTTYKEFVKNSQFGCADCYDVFGPLIRNNIKSLHGSDIHIGKVPKYSDRENNAILEENDDNNSEEDIAILQLRLKDALQEEEYEDAAMYRDKIRELKERNRN